MLCYTGQMSLSNVCCRDEPNNELLVTTFINLLTTNKPMLFTLTMECRIKFENCFTHGISRMG